MKKIISLFLVIATLLCMLVGCRPQFVYNPPTSDSNETEESSSLNTSEDVNNTEEIQDTTTDTTEETIDVTEEVTLPPDGKFPGYKYDTVIDIEDNVFLDALAYTGYNLDKHRKDGLMWQYILSADKKHRNWLSGITYGGGCSGFETKDGLPDIKTFEWGGLVCASFATYVYFNYLPNVAGVDTSLLARPEKSWLAPSFHVACEEWLEDGLTYNIGFTAKNTPEAIVFEEEEEIPLGSIIVFRAMEHPERKTADHVTVYVGKKNGYHWVIQTGNKNGPEFCAVERFKFGPDPMWPLAIYATPYCIYDAITAPTN